MLVDTDVLIWYMRGNEKAKRAIQNLSHSIQLADALIGATSVVNGLPLLTSNTKDCKTIKNIIIKKFHP